MATTLVPVATDPPVPYPTPDALAHALAGRYRLVRRLASGGMSDVYLAWESGLERHVAVKVLNPAGATDVEDRERFRREARTLAHLAHPSIVPVYAAGDSRSVPYFVMAYVPGGSLQQRLEREGRVPVADACAILADIAEALDCAHRSGVVHRDVKPSNILLDEVAGRALLSDFGVAIVQTSDHSRSEVSKALGTPDYMSPEQILGEQEFDGRSDLYALGVVGFRMLTGRLPFRGSSPQAVAAQHVSLEAPAVEGFVSGIPAGVAVAIGRCLEKHPLQRWPDGATLARALRGATVRAPTARAGRSLAAALGTLLFA